MLAKNNIGESSYFEICHDLENLFCKGEIAFIKKQQTGDLN